MATPKQVTLLLRLHNDCLAAGMKGITEPVLATLDTLDHNDVQLWISGLNDRLPVSTKQLHLIFSMLGGSECILPVLDAKLRSRNRYQATNLIQKLRDPLFKANLLESARWETEQARTMIQTVQREVKQAIAANTEQPIFVPDDEPDSELITEDLLEGIEL